jgi:hypothetical protein
MEILDFELDNFEQISAQWKIFTNEFLFGKVGTVWQTHKRLFSRIRNESNGLANQGKKTHHKRPFFRELYSRFGLQRVSRLFSSPLRLLLWKRWKRELDLGPVAMVKGNTEDFFLSSFRMNYNQII